MITRQIKVPFDADNVSHVEIFRSFLTKNGWGAGGCPFKLEYPWTNIPEMIKDRLVAKYLNLESR